MDAALQTPTAGRLLRNAERQLAAAGIDTARLDAEVLLAWALGASRATLYARLGDPVAPSAESRFAAAAERRARREPVAYITGTHEFWSLAFTVNSAVLIPRPETERLVEIVCGLAARSIRPPAAILDIGTGSGCIAVTLAHEIPGARLTAIDRSSDALAVARRNAMAHAVADRIDFAGGDLYAAVAAGQVFDVIVSNPPYLAPGDVVAPELAFEPSSALLAGADGLAVIRRLIAGGREHLRAPGWLVMELGAGQDAIVAGLARAAGFADVAIEPDLAGIPRVLVARRL